MLFRSRYHQDTSTDQRYHVLLPETLARSSKAHLQLHSSSQAGDQGGYQQSSYGQRSYGLRHDVIAIAQTAPELCLIPRGNVSGRPVHLCSVCLVAHGIKDRPSAQDFMVCFNTTFQNVHGW
ncbi:hypothetical protein GE21DRAFT_1204056 [Neurospora crassa]|nr:hypothetical protein GE21DRAFT_1204056 [Neurospora crassa]